MAFQYQGTYQPPQTTSGDFYVHPGGDFGAGLTGLAQSIDETEERNYQRAKEEKALKKEEEAMDKAKSRFEAAKTAMQGALASGEPEEMANVAAEYPEITEMMYKISDHKSEATVKNYDDSIQNILLDPSEENIAKVVDARMGVLDKDGVLNNELTANAMESYRANPEAFLKNIEMDFAVRQPAKWKSWKEAQGGVDGVGVDAPDVQSSQILTDGSIIKVMKDGAVVVENPTGKIVEGVDRALAIEEANKAKVELTGAGAGARTTETQKALFELQGKVAANKITQENAAKAANEMIDSLSGISQKKDYMNETIRLLDEGAQTGPIMKRLPTFKAASMELENIQAKLGLNVIQNTTFGSLSEAELKFALSTALPTGLNEVELRDWAVRKRDALTKLEDYIKSASLYLSEPGNTRSGWLEKQRNKIPDIQEDQTQGNDPLGIR